MKQLFVALLLLSTSSAFAGVDTFPLTYQGSLADQGTPANGIYDFTVEVYGSEIGGSLLADATAEDVEVIQGLFTFTIMLPSTLLDDDLWLGILVEEDGGVGFTPLVPRQPVTPAPQASLARDVAVNSIDSTRIVDGSIGVDDVDTTEIQARASVACSTGFAMSAIAENGAVSCVNIGSGGSGWSLSGNAGTSAGTNFLGTTDNEPIEIHVNDSRVWRAVWEPGAPSSSGPSVVVGDADNSISSGSVGSVIAGGGNFVLPNSITGGYNTIGGGLGNAITAGTATIAGGSNNSVTATNASIGGGNSNSATGNAATIPGGTNNTAAGERSVAMGHQAQALHDNTFVFNDGGGTFASTGAGQFLVDVEDGVGIGLNNPTDLLHINAPPGRNALRVQTDGTTRLRVHDNGGVSVGLNSTPPAAGLLVAGQIELANPVTRWFSIPPNAFIPTYSELGYRTRSGEVVATSSASSAFEEFAAHLALPHGAVVTELRAVVNDQFTTGDLEVRIVRLNLNNFNQDVMAVVASAGQTPGLQVLTDSSIALEVIDNQNYSYAVEFDTDASSEVLTLRSVRVAYTIDSVLP